MVDHLRYIFNRVLLPKVEYIMQTTILSKRNCDYIIAPFWGLIKQRLGLTSSVHNAIIHTLLAIGMTDLFMHQQSAQLDYLNIQLSDQGILGQVSYVQLL